MIAAALILLLGVSCIADTTIDGTRTGVDAAWEGLLGLSRWPGSSDSNFSTDAAAFERVLLSDAASERGAVCLDGSPGAYYVRKPIIDAPKNEWLIFHEGGGWCSGNGGCLHRSTTDLGSSKNYPPTLNYSEAVALFQSLPTFTIIYAKYCDGSSWTGDTGDPVRVNVADSNETGIVYYRGRRLLDALFDDLLTNRGLDAADRVVYGGCSAGALTSYLHIDYVRTLLPDKTRLSGMADAMFSLHHKGFGGGGVPNYYTTQMRWGYRAWNSSRSINDRCRDDYYERDGKADAAWMCLHGAIAVRYVETPMLIINSKYDTWQKDGVLGLDDDCQPSVAPDGTVTLCNNSTPVAQAKDRFWRAYGTAMVRAVWGTVPEWHGAFLTNCPAHCMTGPTEWGDPAGPDIRLGEAVAKWLKAVDLVSARNATATKGWLAPRWIPSEEDKCLRASPSRI